MGESDQLNCHLQSLQQQKRGQGGTIPNPEEHDLPEIRMERIVDPMVRKQRREELLRDLKHQRDLDA